MGWTRNLGASNFLSEEFHIWTGKWEKGKFGGREVVRAANGSMFVGQSVHVKSLDFVLLGKMRKEHQEMHAKLKKLPFDQCSEFLGV